MNSFQNAYVLLYERIETPEEPLLKTTFSIKSLDAVVSPNKENAIIEEPKQFISQIDPAELESLKDFRNSLRERSRNYFTKKLLFNPDYSKFLLDLLGDYAKNLSSGQNTPNGPTLSSENDFFVFQFLLTAFLTTVLRSAEKTSSYEFLKSLIFIIEEDEKSARYLLGIIKNPKFLKEFILECSCEEVRKIASTLIRKVFAANLRFERHLFITDQNHTNNNSQITHIEQEQTSNGEQVIEPVKSPTKVPKTDNMQIMHRLQSSVIGEFLDFILDSLQEFRPYHKNISIHFQNIYRFVRESPYVGEYLLRKGVIPKFISFFSEAEESTSNNENKIDVEEGNGELDNELLRNYNGWGNFDYSIEDLQKANLAYLWMVLAYLVRRASKFYLKPLDAINYSIPSDQSECLFKDGKVLSAFLRNAPDKVTVRLIVRLYCDLCYDNLQNSKVLVPTISAWANEEIQDQLESWFELSRMNLNIADEFQTNRIRTITHLWIKLIRGFAEKSHYFVVGCEWIYRMFTTNQKCLEAAREKNAELLELKRILEVEYEPSDKNIRKRFYLRTTGQQQLEYYRKMKKNVKRVIKKLNKLVDSNENIETNADEVNSQTQEGVAPLKAKKGDKLNYYDMTTKCWYVVEVLSVMEELAEVKYVTSNAQNPAIDWIELDGGYVAPYEKNAGTIQGSKNQSDNRTQSSDTEEICSTEGVPSENEADQKSDMMVSPETGNNNGNTIEY